VIKGWARTVATMGSAAALTLAISPLAVGGGGALLLANTVRHAVPLHHGHAGHGHGPGGSGGGGSSPSYDWASSNWSGYAVANGPYNSVSGQWVVPTVTATKGATYSATWIGIDGFNNSDLIQTGTEQDYSSSGAQYAAWWEILPAAETPIANPVSPGDVMSATITNDNNGDWTITLRDVTKGWTFTTVQTYSGPGASAEWIEEAPTVGGRVATLAHYGQTTFDQGSVNGVGPNLIASQDAGIMIQKRVQVSTPSAPDSEADGFAIAYGSTAPAVPAS
jgi:hypothetical protein